MKIEEFRTLIIDYIMASYENVEATPYDTLKNNGVKLHGVCIKLDDSNVRPTVYLESYFKDYKYGISIENLASQIMTIAKEHSFSRNFDTSIYDDFESVKNRLFTKIINTKQNEELLITVPSRSFMDLSIVVYCDVSDLCGVNATVLIKKEHIKGWKISEEEIIDIAYANTRSKGIELNDICQYLDRELNEHEFPADAYNRLFVFTNEEKLFGAICMTFDDVLDDFLSDRADGAYIIPSSIHEVIIVPVTNERMLSDINDIIESVNRFTVEKEEVLSEHAYYYSSSCGYRTV